jgi:hypothetical protein
MYFARLRQSEPRKYSHWGFEAKYKGEAQKALAKAHADAFREVLRTPISELVEEAAKPEVQEKFLKAKSSPGLVPLALEGQSKSHFQYLLLSVERVLRAKKAPPRE